MNSSVNWKCFLFILAVVIPSTLHAANIDFKTEIQSPHFICDKILKENLSLKTCPLITPPATFIDLITNIKNATALNLLSNDNIFSDDEVLWEIFGASSFSKNFKLMKGVQSVILTSFGYDLDPRMKLSIKIDKLIITKDDWHLGNPNDPTSRIMIIINISNLPALDNKSILDFDKIFGSNSKPYNDYDLRSIERYNPPTQPVVDLADYRKITYKIPAGASGDAEANITFYRKKLDSLQIIIQEK